MGREAQGVSTWGGDTVLTSANGQYGQPTSSHPGTGWYWVAQGGWCLERLAVLCLCSHQEHGWVLPLVSPLSLFFALFQDASGWRHLSRHVAPSSLAGKKCK